MTEQLRHVWVVGVNDGIEPAAFTREEDAEKVAAAARATATRVPVFDHAPEPERLWFVSWHPDRISPTAGFDRVVALRNSVSEETVWPWDKDWRIDSFKSTNRGGFFAVSQDRETAIRLVNEARAAAGMPLPFVAEEPYVPIGKDELRAIVDANPGRPFCSRCGRVAGPPSWALDLAGCPDPERRCAPALWAGPMLTSETTVRYTLGPDGKLTQVGQGEAS